MMPSICSEESSGSSKLNVAMTRSKKEYDFSKFTLRPMDSDSKPVLLSIDRTTTREREIRKTSSTFQVFFKKLERHDLLQKNGILQVKD